MSVILRGTSSARYILSGTRHLPQLQTEHAEPLHNYFPQFLTQVTRATDYFGPALLAHLLLPSLAAAAPSRLVNMSSLGEMTGRLAWNDLTCVCCLSLPWLPVATVFMVPKLTNQPCLHRLHADCKQLKTYAPPSHTHTHTTPQWRHPCDCRLPGLRRLQADAAHVGPRAAAAAGGQRH